MTITAVSLTQSNSVKKTQQALEELNSFVVSHFFKAMYNTDNKNDDTLLGGSGERIFQEFLLNEMSNVLGKKLDLTSEMMGKYVTIDQSKVVIDSEG